MKFLKRFIETVNDRAEFLDFDVAEMLPQNCTWTVAAKAEVRASRGGGIDGILGHNGQRIVFVAWTGRHLFSEQLDDVDVLNIQGNLLRLSVSGIEVSIWDFAPTATLASDPPESIADFREFDEFAGLLSWLPVSIA